MDEVFRHTLLGACIRRILPTHLQHVEQRDPAILKRLHTLEDAENLPAHANESTALLEDVEAEYGRGTYLVEWYGEDDPEHPKNWPLATKVTVTTVLCIVTVATYTGSAFWSVCIDDLVHKFGVPEVVAQLGKDRVSVI